MKRVLIVTVLSIMTLVFSIQANAALELRGTDSLGYRLIYDTDLDITWYDYSNLYADWYEQTSWASSLTVNFGGTIYDDWRLPITNGCQGYDCTESEMGHLYYIELENIGYCDTPSNCDLPDWGLKNTGDFQNISGRYVYGGLPNGMDPWRFNFNSGLDMHGDIDDYYKALAVRDGDVPQQPIVPEPISSILFVTGGTLLAVRRYMKRKI